MGPSRRRVSYVIPPPIDSVPRLQLPPHGISRLGYVGPLLLAAQRPADEERKWPRHPRHRLGVASLALDTSTLLASRGSPEGILYSGGRDGLVISWDLEIRMKKREGRVGCLAEDPFRRSVGRWEIMTGWADDVIDEEEEGEERPADGDVLGDVTQNGSRHRRPSNADSLPSELQWEMDIEGFNPRRSAQFRQCAQIHTDWVNDILLCNLNQTVVSASSDGTVKVWNPHSPTSPDPSTIGAHSDYVRCLAHCREQNWIVSGSFDRTIKLWDLSRTTQDPLLTLKPPDATAPKSSIYAIAADPFGHAIASGSPERVIRMWDPRSGKRTGKLVGHTDNIRAILISADSRYLLTGSADASIKLWSLTTQRCLHTFMHHTESVWSLFSSHPSLQSFYSGDKAGLVCKVDVEDCSDVAEGECIVLCQDTSERTVASSEGINKIVAMDDNILWTASGNSSIKRWPLPRRRAVRASALVFNSETERTVLPDPSLSPSKKHHRSCMSSTPSRPHAERDPFVSSVTASMTSENGNGQRDCEDETTLYGIPFDSLVRLTSPNDPFSPYPSMPRDSEVATLYSAASVMSVPKTSLRTTMQSVFQPSPPYRGSPVGGETVGSLPGRETARPVNSARTEFEERELAADALPLHAVPEDIIHGDHGLVRSIVLNDRIHALTVDTSGEVAVWDVVRCVCLGRYTYEDVTAVSHSGSATAASSGCERDRSPREALEAVRERIEGEAVVVPWSVVDTKTGVLTVHLTDKCFESEIFADEVGYGSDSHFTDETRFNIGKWVLRNLFILFIREEQRLRRKRDGNVQDGNLQPNQHRSGPNHSDVNATSRHRRSSSDSSRRSLKAQSNGTVVNSVKMIPAVQPATSPSTRSSPLIAPMIPISRDNSQPLPPIPQSPLPMLNANDPSPMAQRSWSQTSDGHHPPPSSSKETDYFSVRNRQTSGSSGPLPTPDEKQPLLTDPQSPTALAGATTLMGRLKNFGKNASKKAGDAGANLSVLSGTTNASVGPTAEEDSTNTNVPKTPLQLLLSGPLSPPSSSEWPTISLPSNVSLMISEESSPSWTTVYRGTTSSTHNDSRILEENMPMWLLEYLLTNKAPSVPVHKVSFVMLPWPSKDPDGEQLPELLNTVQSKLTASRFLRVRKLTVHVQDRLDKISASPRSRRSSVDSQTSSSSVDGKRPSTKPEDLYEILCGDVVLPLDMTLAAVRQFVWRQAAELIIYYRRKTGGRAMHR